MTRVGLTKTFPVLFLSLPLALCPAAAIAQAQDLKVEIVPVTPHNMVEAVAFSPSGTQVLSGGGDNTMKLWDVAAGRLLRTFKGHTSVVRAVAFSPDGTKVLSASQDATIKLWDAASGRLLQTFTGHTGTVTSVAFSPDGARFVSGSRTVAGSDNSVRLWDVATGRQLHIFTPNSGEISSVHGTAAVVVELSPGMQVSLIEASGGWALIAREGRRLGYVEAKALVRLQ
jgi:WD40 repeat protein